MDIAYAFDEVYAPHVPVAVESVLDSHRDRDDITFWLLSTSEVLSATGDRFERQVRGRARVRLLAADDEFRALGPTVRDSLRYISNGMYLRLQLADLLPDNVERFLYLDTDTMVLGDLGPLWEMELGQAPLAAVRDHFTATIGARDGIPGMGPELDAAAPYFNSGVLVVQTGRWRAAGVTERCVSYLERERERLRLPDQDALNLATYGSWVELDPKWNDMITWWQEAGPAAIGIDDTRVMHFLGPQKPWRDGFSYGDYRERYLKLAAHIVD